MNLSTETIITIALFVLGGFVQYFAFNTKIQTRLTALETKTELFWKCIEGNVVGLLKSYPTNIKKDILLDKMIKNELTLDDAYELRTIITGEMETNKGKDTLIYILTLGRLEQIIFDLKPRGQ